ncbi:MAG: efflux RND transporter periplasmic adaptor subunit [Spirochaetia bacterium]|nr:efflux RND transporter periplasmic adaptor subunit [Spirochaetia bacterium]
MKLSGNKCFKTATVFLLFMTLAASSCKKKPENNISKSEMSEDVGGYYTCSMHPQVIEKEPGNCPICAMKLVYVEGKKIQHDHNVDIAKAEMYVCPMHPEITKDKPGKCPICKMTLVKMNHKHDEGKISGKTVKNNNFHFSVTTKVLTNANLLTTPAKKEKFSVKADYSGNIDYNEDPDRLVIVNTKYEGWVEALYVSKEGVNVGRGQLLMGVYSPSLLAAKEEYVTTYMSMKGLYVSQGKSGEELSAAMKKDDTVSASRQKLKYLDVSENEINKLETDQKAGRLTYFYSPISGTIIKKDVLQGAYINSGQELMRIANLDQLWVYIHVFEKDLGFLHKGQKATMKISSYPDKEYIGNIDLIFPYLDPVTKDVKVRIVLPNSGGQLKPGMFADVNVQDSLPGLNIVIPDTAIIHSGDESYVFISEGSGNFEMRPVKIKISSNGRSVISGGLSENELVVMSGQFLLDSESSLKEAVSKGKAGMEGMKHEH